MNRLNICILRVVCLISVLGAGQGLSGASGQSPVLSGTVTDSSDGTAVAGVIVQLCDAEGKAVSFALSGKDGGFTLRPSRLPEEAKLVFSCMGFQRHVHPVATIDTPIRVALVAEVTEIREVTVHAPSILQKGDTLVFNVEKFADEQDRSIEDVLKKMPGIEVSESGQIRYNGEPINKFYIEGSDLLEGRYALASKNISHKDVKNVELMENHQPVKALEGIEHSEQAAINLRLQEDAKLRWAGTFNGGSGFTPALWDASLFAMRIAGKWQSIETMKANNTGKNPATENTRFTFDNILGPGASRDPLPDYVRVGSSSAPLADNRTRFNRSVSANTTNSRKIGRDYDLKANINYTGERLTAERRSSTDYFDASIAPFSEYENNLLHTHDLSALLTLQANTRKFYLKNNLDADFGWRDVDSRVTGSFDRWQSAETPFVRISNDLQLVRRINDRTFTFSSLNRFVRKPHSLLVEAGENRYDQDVKAWAFQSVTEGSFGWVFGRFRLRARAGLEINHRALESDLIGIDLPGYDPQNDARITSEKVYLQPDLTYEYRRFRLSLGVPVNYYARQFEDKRAADRINDHDVTVSPTLSLRYQLSARWELLGGGRYTMIPPTENRFYNGVILSDYRNLSLGLPLFENGKSRSANVALRYRNPLESFFANASMVYSKNEIIPRSEQVFAGDYIVNTYLPLAGDNQVLNVKGGVSKGFGAGKILVGVDAGYTRTEAESARNGESVFYRSNKYTLEPRVKGTIARWLTTEYNLAFSHNRLRIGESGQQESTFNDLKQTLSFSVSATKKWRFSGGAEHYHTLFSDDSTKDLVLVDAGIRWVFTDKAEFQVSASNLLDKREYRYVSYGSLSETVQTYRIRPRNVLLSFYFRF